MLKVVKYLELFCTLEASETVWLAESWDTKHLQGKINQSGRDLVTLEKKKKNFVFRVTFCCLEKEET